MKKFVSVAAAVIIGGLATQAAPAHAAVNCLAIGAQACLDALDRLINGQTPVEAWATGQYNNYVTRNCQGGPSSTALYTFYGAAVNKLGQLVDQVLPDISCNECEVMSQISSLASGVGYLGQCVPTTDESWTFIGNFCYPPAPQGSFVEFQNIDLYTAATYFVECGPVPSGHKSACSPIHGCLR
jgi:hypothetical protein